MDNFYLELKAAVEETKKYEARHKALEARVAALEKEIVILNQRLKTCEYTCLTLFDTITRSAQEFINTMYSDAESAREESKNA